MAAGGGFKWLTQNVFHNRLHILNHMSIHWSRKTFVYACARAFLWLCVKASENVCRARVSGNHWWLCLLSYQTNHTHFPSRPSFQAEHSKPTVTAPLHSVGCSLNTSWPCDSLQLPFDWMLRGGRMKRRGGGGRGTAWSWLAADTWEKTNSCPIAMEMSQQRVGGGHGYGAQADLL